MNYSNINFEAKPLTKTLDKIRKKIEQETSSYYNSVLMNLYRNGNDSMGWHSDDENIYNPQAPIASLSLGGSRWMKFKKTKKGLGKKTLKLRLNTGDLILMKHPTQEILKHTIPKSSTDIEERINLTFRSVIEKKMFLKLNIERPKKEKLLQELTGDSFSFFERLKNKIFGSPRYDIISIEPDILKEKPPGRICANIEIRKNGVVVYFRFNHDEYALATSKFHQLTIMKGQNLVIQVNTHRLLLKISNNNQHLTFVRTLINQKAKFCGDPNIF